MLTSHNDNTLARVEANPHRYIQRCTLARVYLR